MQQQTCLAFFSRPSATSVRMAGVEDDIRMVQDLVRWTGSNVNQITKRIGMANTTLNRFFNGSAKGRLHRDTIAKLREAFPEFPAFNDADQTDIQPLDPGEYLSVDILPSFVGMGGGGNGDGQHGQGLVPRRLIEDELHAKASDFLLIEARGESMEPDFLHGDQILIDKRDVNPVQPGSFALWDGDGYVVKLVERVPHKRGFYRIFSANNRYSAYEVPEDEIKIMGRPVWFARRL